MAKKKTSLIDQIEALKHHHLGCDDPWGLYGEMIELDDVRRIILQHECDHKFVGSKCCAKCGWRP